MAGCKKETWTLEQWVAYGNRVKRLRKEVLSLLEDSQRVSRAKDMDILISVLSKIDKYKSAMEDVAARTVRDTLVTKIFYGDVIPENRQKDKSGV